MGVLVLSLVVVLLQVAGQAAAAWAVSWEVASVRERGKEQVLLFFFFVV